MEKKAKIATKTAAHAARERAQVERRKAPAKTPQRRAGDVEQAWQRAKLEPGRWPLPGPIHGKAGFTWAVLSTGEKVKWSDLGMDRRLEERMKVWRGE